MRSYNQYLHHRKSDNRSFTVDSVYYLMIRAFIFTKKHFVNNRKKGSEQHSNTNNKKTAYLSI